MNSRLRRFRYASLRNEARPGIFTVGARHVEDPPQEGRARVADIDAESSGASLLERQLLARQLEGFKIADDAGGDALRLEKLAGKLPDIFRRDLLEQRNQL
jgi:hypothetical protein